MPQRVLIVTGASKGIGKAAALYAIKHSNANVVAIARNPELLKQLQAKVAQHGKENSLLVVSGDVTDPMVIQQAIDGAISRWGRIDGVVANAGVLEPIANVRDVDLNQWKRLFDINFFSVIQLIQKALPHLRETKGAIVMVSSGAAKIYVKGWDAYGSSKAALNHLASTLSVEEPDITTIAFRPGVVATDMQKYARDAGKGVMDDSLHKEMTKAYKEGKLLQPETPGSIIARLALDPPRSLTGSFVAWDDDALENYRS
ncbi:short-chain dehydrogenase [Lichtheimia corymbifera JMRC:FSU:9682]|uniref:Short-chain dehydrogenase n=1 Tax=Lichtheimia corymbifera JMRC:FSU:9682 TaxID=1263082 RepID=A0A068S459_9FUNG|nr:short-chain dehydrogenase [Lichtheimia corymbifera JMRC:FSU:9682]